MLLTICMLYKDQFEDLIKTLSKIKQCKILNEIEVLIIDNGSNQPLSQRTDFIKEDFIKLIPKDQSINAGIAKNIAINETTSTWITYIEVYDDFDVHILEQIISICLKEKDNLTLCEIYPQFMKYVKKNETTTGLCPKLGLVTSHFYRTDFLKSNGINFGDFPFHEDVYFSLLLTSRMNYLGYAPLLINDACFYYENTIKLHEFTSNMALLEKCISHQEAASACFTQNMINNKDFTYNLCCTISYQIFYYWLILKYIFNYTEEECNQMKFVSKFKDTFNVTSDDIYNHILSVGSIIQDMIKSHAINFFKNFTDIDLQDTKLWDELNSKITFLDWLKTQKSTNELLQEQTNNIELVLAEMFKNQLLNDNS